MKLIKDCMECSKHKCVQGQFVACQREDHTAMLLITPIAEIEDMDYEVDCLEETEGHTIDSLAESIAKEMIEQLE